MNPIADLRAAVLSLPQVPDETPVEPGFVYGSPSVLAYDANANIIRLNIGGGDAHGRPTFGQLRSWLGLPSGGSVPSVPVAPALAGPWDSLRAMEPPTLRGILTFISAAASGYHGSKRNNSLMSGVIWFIAGAMLPGIVPVLAISQGFGEPKKHC